MKERPILMSGPNILPILEGRKTQTRRAMKNPSSVNEFRHWHGRQWERRDGRKGLDMINCPYGQPGDRLYVKENGWEPKVPTPRELRDGADTWPEYFYDADGISEAEIEQFKQWGWKRRSSRFMPRRFSRILLEITEIRVERLQEISEADAIAEGIDITQRVIKRDCVYGIYQCKLPDGKTHYDDSAYNLYRKLWESINGAGSWDANPWVWVIAFKRTGNDSSTQ